MEAFKASDPWMVYEHLSALDESFHFLRDNYYELDRILANVEAPENDAIYWNFKDLRNLDEAMFNCSRHLFNFVASGVAFIDHYRTFTKTPFFRTHKGFVQTYERRKSKLAKDDVLLFFKYLRQFSQHYQVMIASGRYTKSMDAPTSRQLVLDVERLLEFSGWKGTEAFIISHGEKVPLRPLTRRYMDMVGRFYDWFRTRQLKIHSSLLRKAEEGFYEFGGQRLRCFWDRPVTWVPPQS